MSGFCKADRAHLSEALTFVLTILLCSGFAQSKIQEGGVINSDTVIHEYETPMLIKRDVIVDKDVTLTLEAGVELRFAPGVTLGVNGTLIARGTPNQRIKLTKDPGTGTAPPRWPGDIRLVDERTVSRGRLQVRYRGLWRGVCANFQNWTQEDTNVTCQQLGFKNGTFSFVSFATNDSMYMLYHRPQCRGDEQHVLDCPGARGIQIGSRICENQQTVHLICDGLAPGTAVGHWSGLEFFNSTHVRVQDGPSILINKSASVLEYVDVEFAGVDQHRNPTPAVRAAPLPPRLFNVAVRYSALDGTNFTDVKTSTEVAESLFTGNRGHGLVVESHFGRVQIRDTDIIDNMGNGIKAKFLDGKWPFYEGETFCEESNQYVNSYPHVVSGIPTLPSDWSCTRTFKTGFGQIMTLNFVEMNKEEAASGEITVYDGQNDRSFVLAKFPVINGTMPQGITSTHNYISVKFAWKRLPSSCPRLIDCIKFTIIVDSGLETVPEFTLYRSNVYNNTQHGAYIENSRNYVFINESKLTHNGYGAGVRVYGGAADVHVNASNVDYNTDNGVNITHDGGWRIFNMSSFSHNLGNGINITFNETAVDNKTRIAKHQITEVWKSQIDYNEGTGVRVGNYCRNSLHNVNDSTFIENKRDGLEFESCFKQIPDGNMTNMTAGWNLFAGNRGHGIRIEPLINAVGRIGNNTFRDHPRHALLLDNGDDFLRIREFYTLKVDYEVTSNRFVNNEGHYVAKLRLTQGTSVQKMIFKHNTLKDNRIEGMFPSLNPRLRVHAVIIVSSNNVNVSRNYLVNPNSNYELATHLLDRSSIIEATRNWWDTLDYHKIITKIFDQFNRYNLALLQYHPVLKYEDELYGSNEDYVTNRVRPEEVKFDRGNVLGGRLAIPFTTDYRETHYYVDRDLTILPEGRLTILPGTTLEFPNGIGMLVHGRLDADANEREPIFMKLKNETTMTNSSFVRLVDGDSEMEGRLEVRPNDEEEWGTVCNRGWTITDASVVCQMLGMVVHPDDWRMMTDFPGERDQPIWRSQVACTDLDLNMMECRADDREQHSCDHSMDVSVRCHSPTWAGVRLLATAQRSTFDHVTITDTGLMDPTVILYSPAIHIDYNRHRLERLTITRTMADGIEIVRNDPYSNCKLSHSHIANNMGNGVSIRAPFFEIEFSNLTSNTKTGFMYNPHYTSYEALQLRTGIHDPRVINDIDGSGLDIREEGYYFLTTRESAVIEDATYDVEIRVDSGFKVVVDVLDYNPDVTQEKVTVYDGRRTAIRPGTIHWAIEEDLVDFPVVSSGNVATLRWRVTGPASGRAAFVVRAKRHSWEWPFPDLVVRNTSIHNNTMGVVTRHYNQPSNEFYDLFFRYRWQTISMHAVHFKNNKDVALHVPSITKYHEFYVPTYQEFEAPFRVAEIVYAVEDSLFEGNGDLVRGEHNHVEFSNNVWIWQVTNNVFERNRGGFTLELPKVNLMYQEVFNHSVDVNDTIFERNEHFEFRIDGFYCNSSVARNRFQHNKCRVGCITFTGTEKDFDIQENQVYDNTGKYMMEFFMNSHTPYTRWVDAIVMYNEFKRNTKYETYKHSVSSSPDTYTLGIKGVQNITLNRNLFKNDMDYEMVAGQSSNILENYLDVTENYWGTDNQLLIKERLFDFDDWNNYAIAEYYPYLLLDSFDSPTATTGKAQANLDVDKPLGGRIERPMTLSKREEPYIVHKDLTIMPKASLYIESGVELLFYPNVGILVLGSLTVRGYEDDRVRFGPVDLSDIGSQGEVGRKKRDTSAAYGENYIPIEDRPQPGDPGEQGAVRLVGGDHPYEGFMEIYNATERRWTIICDSSFNRETAEVGCRKMGMETSNVVVRRFRYYDIFVLGFPLMHEQVIEWFHRYSYICDGSENGFEQCRYKINIGLPMCMDARDYVFVRCGPRNLADNYEYWGNLRFSTPEYEADKISPGYSSLEFLDIYGAGMLHEEHAAAVQAVYRTPITDNVRITNCAWNGYDFIAPKDEFLVTNNVISNNHGYGIGGIALNGDSNYDISVSTFRPLVENHMPYNTFGVVRMCTSEKLIYVRERVLLYFKYDYENVDCIKVLRSKVYGENKRMALRFLQINLYNDTFYRNAVEMYNGDYFEPELLIGELTGNSTMAEKRMKFETSGFYDTMGVRVTASAAHGSFGFIAEVVTVPVSPGWKPILGPGLRQWIVSTAITDNEGGGFSFQNVGELNPTVLIEGCRIQNCGLKMLNMTSPGVIDMYVQNTRMCTIANNFLGDNAAGITVETYSNVNSNALYANITNNVIIYTTHGEPLHVEGHYFQGFYIKNNFIAHNRIAHRNVVSLFGVQANFTINTLTNNTARTIINASVPSNIDITQRFDSNYIYENLAIGGNFTTIFLYSPRFLIRENFLFNTHNMFELVTFNRSKPLKWEDNNQDYPQVEAENNFWGSPNPAYVAGRIWERHDDDNLIGVRFEPFYKANTSVLQDKCPPGFRLYPKVNSCYMYMGAVLPYHEAEKQCQSNGARIGWARHKDVERFMGELVSSAQENYDERWRVWVDHRKQDGAQCSSLRNYKISMVDCDRLLPYICERDPYVIAEMYWRPIIIVLGIIAAAIIIIIMMLFFAWLKARNRTKERLDRRNSLRASIRSSKASVLANSRANLTTPTPSGVNSSLRGSKRRRPPLTKVDMTNGILDLSGVTVEETDTDSMQKYKYGGYDYDTRRIDSRRTLDTHRPGTPASSVDYDYSMANKLDGSSYFESDLQDNIGYPYRQENEIERIPTRPMYDPMLQGDIGHDDQSLIRETPQKVPARPALQDYSNVAYDDQSLDRSYAGSPRRIPARPAFDYNTQGSGYDDLSMDRPSPMNITSPRRPPPRPELDFVPVRPSPPSSVDQRDSPAGSRPSPGASYQPSTGSYRPSPAGSYHPSPLAHADSPMDYRESPYDEPGFDRQYQASPRRAVPGRPAMDRDKSSSSEYLADKPKPKETAM